MQHPPCLHNMSCWGCLCHTSWWTAASTWSWYLWQSCPTALPSSPRSLRFTFLKNKLVLETLKFNLSVIYSLHLSDIASLTSSVFDFFLAKPYATSNSPKLASPYRVYYCTQKGCCKLRKILYLYCIWIFCTPLSASKFIFLKTLKLSWL